MFKKGDRYIISNYTPTSLLTSFSNIFEKLTYVRLHDHLNQHNILTTEQYGFRTNSTEKASYSLIHEILLAMNNKSAVGGIFCELRKAYDCVNHRVLLDKLKFYGITGKFHSIIKSYLERRYQKGNINNCTLNHNTSSNWMEIKHRVPQGSVLEPLFFLTYINDLKLSNKNVKILLYADDRSIIMNSPNPYNYQLIMKHYSRNK
jgi:hypothetical protein